MKVYNERITKHIVIERNGSSILDIHFSNYCYFIHCFLHKTS